jgi:GntR family transcriptional regulator, vanillate catabolism transcriptional regulator
LQEFNSKDRRINDEFVSQTGRTLLNLREMLLRGDFRPGERISELPLVARLGVSRTPIRLALDRLAHEGLLEVAPSGGFVVREFTRADMWDAIEVRGVLEGTAARLAAERLEDDRELEHLRIIQSQMDAIQHPTIDTFARYIDLNESFHSSLHDLAKSPMLRRALEKVMTLPFAAPSALVFARAKLPRASEVFTIAQAHHHSILEALAARQGARAENLAREHALLSRKNLEMVLADESLLSSIPGASLLKLSVEE